MYIWNNQKYTLKWIMNLSIKRTKVCNEHFKILLIKSNTNIEYVNIGHSQVNKAVARWANEYDWLLFIEPTNYIQSLRLAAERNWERPCRLFFCYRWNRPYTTATSPFSLWELRDCIYFLTLSIKAVFQNSLLTLKIYIGSTN